MSELKKCPFCGWEFAEHAWNEFGEEYRVCDQCGASSGTVNSMWDWNNRPIEDALQAENEWLKEELQQEKTRSQLNFEAEERRMLNITYYCAEIDRLNARIAELEAAQRWIPVSERLPEEGHKVLVLLTDGAISIDLIYGNDFLYENWVGDITHWMPLPKLPEVQE